MQYAHNTVLITPLLTISEQKKVRELSFVREVLPNGKTGRVSIMGTPTKIAAITCTVPEPSRAADGGPVFSTQESDWINRTTRHMLTAVQIGHDKDADYFRTQDHGIFSFSTFSENETPTFGLETELIGGDSPIDANGIAMTYSVTSERNLHHVMELLSESMAWRIPAHYRFLALYKIIELEHPHKTADFHSSMDEAYAAVSATPRPLRKLMPQIRVKVAHAVGSGASAPGLTMDESLAVTLLIPIMQSAIHADIAHRYGMQFSFTPG